jgi:integrase
VSTGVKVMKSEWAAGAICNRPDSDILNARVRILYNRVMTELNERMEAGETIDVAYIRKKVWQMAEAQTDNSMLDWIEEQVPMLNVKEGTRKHYMTVLLRLTEYGEMKSWRDLSVEGLYKWDAWLHRLPAQSGGLISDGGVYTYHKCLKALLNRAYEFGCISENPYSRLRGKFKRGEKENIEFLTEEEIQRIMDLKLPAGSKLDTARDLFVFQIWSGLSFSDAEAFNVRLYKFDSESGTWKFTGKRIKTGVPYVSQLLPPVVDVLQKHGMKVPQIDNSDYNHLLKLIGDIAGIDTRMHSHLGRHTFATYMLRNGTRFENVSKMLGHKNLTQTLRYAKVLAESVHEDYDKVANKLKNK